MSAAPPMVNRDVAVNRDVVVNRDVTLCGWRVRSAVPLPSLLPWSGDDRPPDITIRLGRVTVPDDLPFRRVFMQIGADGTGWVTVPDVVRMQIRGGTEVTVDPLVAVDAPDIALFLLGSGLGILCHQRHILPLHGSCVELDGRAVLFCGASGQGKSTLAAALAAQGLRVLSDDVTPVLLPPDGPPLAVPSFPRQKLWQDSLTALGLTAGERVRQAGDIEKFSCDLAARFCPRPLPVVAAISLVTEKEPGQSVLSPLRGSAGLLMLRRSVYRAEAAGWLRPEEGLFHDLVRLASGVAVAALRRPADFAVLSSFAAALPDQLRAAFITERASGVG